MIFVDTNIFLRFFLKDHSEQSPKAAKLFQKAKEGKVKLWTTEWVIAEIYWVLSFKGSKLAKTSLFEILWTIIEFRGLEIKNRKLVIEALSLAQEKNIELGDALNAILAKKENINTVYSYDKDFERFEWLKRKEP